MRCCPRFGVRDRRRAVTATPIPEWNGKKLFVMMEDDAYLTDQGFRFFRPRQEQYYLITSSGSAM